MPNKEILFSSTEVNIMNYMLCLAGVTGTAKGDRDQNKRTPLPWAAEYGALDSVKILLEHGAKINSTENMDSTPIVVVYSCGPTYGSSKSD
jgi:hypothetical protein